MPKVPATQPEDDFDDDDDGGLERLTALSAEITEHMKRLKSGDFDTKAEMSDTVMSLLDDLAKLVTENILYLRDWADDVSDEVFPEDGEGDEADDVADDSVLLPEDATLIGECLGMLRESLAAGMATVADESQRQSVMIALQKVEKAIARVAEITLVDDEADDEEEGDDDTDAEGDEAEADKPLPVG